MLRLRKTLTLVELGGGRLREVDEKRGPVALFRSEEGVQEAGGLSRSWPVTPECGQRHAGMDQDQITRNNRRDEAGVDRFGHSPHDHVHQTVGLHGSDLGRRALRPST